MQLKINKFKKNKKLITLSLWTIYGSTTTITNQHRLNLQNQKHTKMATKINIQANSQKCRSCGSGNHCTTVCPDKHSWSDEDDDTTKTTKTVSTAKVLTIVEEPTTKIKISYVSIASRNVCLTHQEPESEPEVEVDPKKEMTQKCENAVLEWVEQRKRKTKKINTESVPKDQKIICNRCSVSFIFTQESKEKYEKKGWKAPKICTVCSQERYEERKAEGY